MKKILVITPPKFGLTDEELEAFMNRHFELVHAVEIILGEYCERANWYAYYSILTENTLENKKKNFEQYVEMLLNFKIDYALFADGWQNSEECKILHSIAEMFHVPILDMDNKENVSC